MLKGIAIALIFFASAAYLAAFWKENIWPWLSFRFKFRFMKSGEWRGCGDNCYVVRYDGLPSGVVAGFKARHPMAAGCYVVPLREHYWHVESMPFVPDFIRGGE